MKLTSDSETGQKGVRQAERKGRAHARARERDWVQQGMMAGREKRQHLCLTGQWPCIWYDSAPFYLYSILREACLISKEARDSMIRTDEPMYIFKYRTGGDFLIDSCVDKNLVRHHHGSFSAKNSRNEFLGE